MYLNDLVEAVPIERVQGHPRDLPEEGDHLYQARVS